ncbi:MAG: helix-turn-helix transcriptional regulator [bacterium]
MAVWNNTQWNTILLYVMPRAIYTKDHNVIVERLKKARFESGLGQVEASKKLGKTQSYLSKIESGQRRFDVLQLKEFAKLYKKPLDYFVK